MIFSEYIIGEVCKNFGQEFYGECQQKQPRAAEGKLLIRAKAESAILHKPVVARRLLIRCQQALHNVVQIGDLPTFMQCLSGEKFPKTPYEKMRNPQKLKGEKFMSDVRNKVYNFRANESVSEIIETKFRLSNCRTKSDFIRSMIFNRMVVKYDEAQLQKIFSLMNNITNNLNQISLKARATNSPCVMEIEQLKGEADEVWQLLKSMQSILLKIKP